MPRKTFNLPDDRSEWSFGELLYWHLFEYGTQPDGRPDEPRGRRWHSKEVSFRLGHRSRTTLWNWINDKNFPDDTIAIENLIFGKSDKWDEQRKELRERLDRQRRVAASARISAADHAKDEIEFPPPDNSDPEHRKWELTRLSTEDEHFEASRKDIVGERPRSVPEVIPKWSYYYGAPRRRPRVSTLATILVLLVGGLALTRSFTTSAPTAEEKVEAPVTTPVLPPKKEVAPPVKQVEIAPPAPEKKAPVVKKIETPPPPALKQELTEEQQREAEKDRVIRETILANRKAHENAVAEQNRLAKQRDEEELKAARLQRDRQADALNIAGMGFDLRQNTSVTGQSIGIVQSETVADCALACLKDNCDGFAYYHDQNVTKLRKTRACYRYRAPLTFFAHPHYTAGAFKKSATRVEQNVAGEVKAAPIQLAQSKSPSQNDATDGVLQCANGPVKVTGFKLACDRILGGGTTLGSAQLSYTVAHINECASKCRLIQKCVGFTFNAADTPGRHSCMIFGPTPEVRAANGWVSGQR